MNCRKICVITGSRAEYGLLYWLMKGIQNDNNFELQIVATGAHLSPEFGLTYKEIEKDGFLIDRKVEMLISADTPSSISKSCGLGMIGFADVFEDLVPDMIIMLGDRYELLSAASCALIARIPIAHISGGETTAGAFDEAIRHSITKMAWWHFTAAEEYSKRVIQLGEDPDRVFLVGGLGVDSIKKSKLLSKKELSKNINFKFGTRNLLVTYHPVTLEKNSSKNHFHVLLEVLESLNDIKIIFTEPNADTDGRVIKEMMYDFYLKNKDKSIYYKNMGQLNYLSTLQFVDAIVGNSSSGLSEAPTFKIGTINIGDRQKGRMKAVSVVDCKPSRSSIKRAINKIYSHEFQNTLRKVKNPYGDGEATEKILDILKTRPFPSDNKKDFYDL